MTVTLVFPVGHYGGRFFPAEGAPLRSHLVRVGLESERLRTDAQMRVWALAHGLPHADPTEPWTPSDVVEQARALGVDDPAAILADLQDRGLVATVRPGTDDAAGFAGGHRLEPLLTGLGERPDDPTRFSIGVAGLDPIVTVSRVAAELWQWGHLGGSVQGACALMSAVARDTGGGYDAGPADPRYADEETLLDALFPAIRVLVARSAAFLDVTRPA